MPRDLEKRTAWRGAEMQTEQRWYARTYKRGSTLVF